MTAAPIDSAAPARASSDTAALVPTATTPTARTGRPDAIMSDPVTAADVNPALTPTSSPATP